MADLFDLLMAEELSPAEMPPPRPPVALVEPPATPVLPLAKIEPSEAISGPAVEFNNPGLRQYQRDLIAQFWERIEAGNRKVMLVMPTGAGKTLTCVEIIDQCVQKGMKVLFLAHRRELVNQASRTLHRGHLDHGIIQAGFPSNLYRSIQVASVQTVHARAVRRSVIDMPEFQVVVVDECFPAGTLVDGRPIEEFKIGDMVRSVNHDTGAVEMRRVEHLFRSAPGLLVTVHLTDGRKITCTAGHPFYTPEGYLPARSLNSTHSVLSSMNADQRDCIVRGMLNSLRVEQRPGISSEERGPSGLLLGSLQIRGSGAYLGGDNSSNEPQVCFGTNDGTQSDEEAGSKGQAFENSSINRSCAAVAWRQWNRDDGERETSGGRHRPAPHHGKDETQVSGGVSASLQTGPGGSADKNGRGDRWGQPSGTKEARTRSEKGSPLAWVGVDHIEVHQRTGEDGHWDMCPDDLVYNLEVEGNHNYFVEDVLVHNCHRIRGQSYQQIIAQFPNAIVIGLTATPCRGDGKGLGAVFDYMVVGPDVEDLVKAGHLVGSRVYAPSRPDLKEVKVARGDYAEDQLAERMNTKQLVGDVILHWQRLAQGKQTIVFASSVAHSVHLCDEFRKANVLAEHIDGTTPSEERDSILKRLANGDIDVVVNCQVLTEGFDCPNIGCIVLARPTKSVGLFRQMVGRGLRPAPGKTELLLLDHAGAVFEHGFIDERMTWALREDDQAVNHRQKARQSGSVPKLVACPECSAINWQGRPCSACGWRPRIKGAGMEMGEGELGEVDRTTRKAKTRKAIKWEMKEFYGMLKHVAESRGYKPGWAYHKFRVKFPANAPGRDWPSVTPSPELMSWVRSQAISWSKSSNNR